jgi:hypothetical protein
VPVERTCLQCNAETPFDECKLDKKGVWNPEVAPLRAAMDDSVRSYFEGRSQVLGQGTHDRQDSCLLQHMRRHPCDRNVYQDVLHTFAIDAESLRSACTTCTPFAESALALSEAGSRVNALMVTFPDFSRASTTPPPCDCMGKVLGGLPGPHMTRTISTWQVQWVLDSVGVRMGATNTQYLKSGSAEDSNSARHLVDRRA